MFHEVFSVFSVKAEWIAEMLLMLFFFFLLILLCNGQNIAKYEAYWLIGVPKINP